jgi:RNA polymerase sigma factor (sigma-70 family)
MAHTGRPRLDHARQLELLEQARAGTTAERRQALDTLLADFRAPAMAVIHKTLAAHGTGPDHAEGVLQEAAVKFLARGLDAFGGRAAPSTYFCRVAINAALDACRRLDTRGGWKPDRAEQAGAGGPEGPEEALLRREGARLLWACLGRLADHYRLAVELFYLEEVGDAATCAARADVSVQAFWQRLCRARAMLADCVRRGAVLGEEDEA